MSADQEPLRSGLDDLKLAKKSFMSVDAFSFALVGAVVVAVLLSIYFYRQSFSGELSVSPDRWSAFGSYVGGLFGPLISFLTLLAILKTIGLQKDLLDTQRYEFEAMQRLQAKTLDSQLAQIERANADSNRRVVEETRLNVLKTVDGYLVALNSEYEIKQRAYEVMLQRGLDGDSGPTMEQITKVRSKLDDYKKRLSALTMLHGDLCFNEFTEPSLVKAHFQSAMEKIWNPVPSPTDDGIGPQAD